MNLEVGTGNGISIPSMKSLFIKMYSGELLLASATAFLAANNRESHCALITNRHNVTGRNQETGRCLHSKGAEPDTIEIFFHKKGAMGEWIPVRLPLYRDDGSPFWIEHPRLGAEVDVIALNLKWGSDVEKYPYYMDLDLDHSVFVGPAEPVSVIGFPFGVSAHGYFPIWSTGFLAQDLNFVTSESPQFLIDCRTRVGQSGSAVIAYRTGSFRCRSADGRIVSTISPTPRWDFMGIYSGRMNADSDIGRVWHASVVKEILTEAEIVFSHEKK